MPSNSIFLSAINEHKDPLDMGWKKEEINKNKKTHLGNMRSSY
jgi:hypothetical protein